MLRPFLVLALVVISTSVSDQVVQVVIRLQIGHVRSLTEAGYWQAVNRLSDAYLYVVGAVLVTAYQPLVRAAETPGALSAVVRRTLAFVLPLTVVSGVVIYLLRGWLVRLLLSGEFAPVADHIALQLVGDVLFILSTALGYVLLIRDRPRVFVMTALAYSALYLALSVWWVHQFGWVGAVAAYVVAHALYLVLIWPLYRRATRVSVNG